MARVLTLKPFGAFVELKGYQTHGLVHISQMAAHRVEAVEDVVAVGDTVKVKVIKVEADDRGRSKVSVSMKQVDQATGQDLGGDSGANDGGGGGGGGSRRRRDEEEDLTQYSFGAKGGGGQLTALERDDEPDGGEPSKPKEKANYETTGKLAEAANTVNGVNMVYGEPPEAAKPTKHWRLYVFKGKEALEPYHVHRQSMYLLGRDRRVADIPLDHPSCSSQHCVLQFRMTTLMEADERGERRQTRRVRPYLIDLKSTNGCFIHDERIEPQVYVELKHMDKLRFGFSSREYVLLNADAEQ